MPAEVWGYRVGDHVEVRTAVSLNKWTWRPGKVTRIDSQRNVWVGSTRVRTPKDIRVVEIPTTPEDIERWLET